MVIETAREGIAVAGEALDLYNRVLDQVVPWQSFEETLAELDHFRSDYSKESGDLLGQIKTCLMDGMDAYFRSTQSVYEWSSLVVKLLDVYIQLFDQNDETKSESQKSILVSVLGDGIEKMKVAQKELENSSSSFNQAAGKLTSLNHRLAIEFDSKSDYYAEKVAMLRIKGYSGAAIFGLTGLGVAYIVLENKMIPELTAKLESIKRFYEDAQSKVSKAFDDIDETKNKLKDEIRVIGDLKVQTLETKTFVVMDKDLCDVAINSARELIEKCHEYRKRHIN